MARGNKSYIHPVNSKTANNMQPTSKPTKKLHHPSRSVPIPVASPSGKGPALPIEILLLGTLSTALHSTLTDARLPATIQKIKSLLYDKKFLEVFEDEALLMAYGARWVPSRALAFREVLEELEHVKRLLGGRRPGGVDKGKGKAIAEEEPEEGEGKRSILCIGGGAGSELLALAAVLASQDESSEAPRISHDLHLFDIGPYSSLLTTLAASLPGLLPSSHPHTLTHQVHRTDILSTLTPSPYSASSFPHILANLATSPHPPLITLLFTLTELFAQSRPATILFLRQLTSLAPKGTLFLLADSANEEASALQVGVEGRVWGLGMVLDGLLCASRTVEGGEGGVEQAQWRCLEKEDSKWYRLREGLQVGYPVKLENMRYWMRLYRKI